MTKVGFFLFETFHARQGVGSSRLRGHNLIKYWPEAEQFKYAQKYDAIIFQKVYMTQDYKFHKLYKGIKIMDICDPDWVDGVAVRETLDNVDGITVPTEALKEFLSQMTDKPIKVIPDRHDIEPIPSLKTHTGQAKSAVWFGYRHNADLLKFAVSALETRGLKLTIISNEDPSAWRWANDPETYRKDYDFKKYTEDTVFSELTKHDFCIMPPGTRPQDRFKSNNKTTKAWLAGLPVVTDADSLENALNPDWRNEEAKRNYDSAIIEYDVKKSVEEMKKFIKEISTSKTEHHPLPYSPVSPSSSVKSLKIDPIAE